jgi:3-dehydroquinate synthase
VSAPHGLVRLTARAAGETSEVVLGRGLAAAAGDLLARHRGARVFLVTDARVGPLHAERWLGPLGRSGFDVHVVEVPAGEEAKTLAVLERLYGACRAARIERGDLVLALGGGAVGDVAGMLAATYLRGLELVQAPTSLVAMVTASVGGKVGINFGGAKNLVGAFKQPALVLADLDALSTLPEVEFRSGLGELVTVGVLGAPALFEALEARSERGPLDPRDAAELAPLLAAAIECKAVLVEADPFDRTGVRARLNLGHTFAHALEALSGFRLPHGLAVAVGLHAATLLAAAAGLCESGLPGRVRRVLRALGLPAAVQAYDVAGIVAAMREDKKKRGGRLVFVLPIRVGEVKLVAEDDLPRGALEDVLQRTVAAGAGQGESAWA